MNSQHLDRKMFRGQDGVTLTELLVTISVIATLACLLFPVVQNVRDRAAGTKCVAHLRQIGTATGLYGAENSGEIPYANYWSPTGTTWATVLASYLQTKLVTGNDLPQGVFRCPSCNYGTYGGSRSHYAKNFYINGQKGGATQQARTINYSLMNIPNPSRYYYIADGAPTTDGFSTREIGTGMTALERVPACVRGIEFRHKGRANILFFDFHVESLAPANIPGIVYGQPPWCPRT